MVKLDISVTYDKVHKVLAEGNFVLAMSECYFKGVSKAFYDLWRIERGKINEHWDTIETIPPKEELKNNGGEF
jgi:predicted SnoaL-like aldol condensation-catalyzing enzyme